VPDPDETRERLERMRLDVADLLAVIRSGCHGTGLAKHMLREDARRAARHTIRHTEDD
jgi:hypothetical protein